MIPIPYLNEWRNLAPWSEMYQIEQDLILTRALIELYSDPLFSRSFAFRGGTAMQKLFFDPPIRYSEDIDLVQIRPEPIGPSIDAIRKILDPWLGVPKRDRKQDRVTLNYRYEAEAAPNPRMRLKIEVNTGEHFAVLPLQQKTLTCKSRWFQGEAALTTYELEELLGTKLRALYQRKKGRDLLDLAAALGHFPKLNPTKIIECFQRYMDHVGATVSRAQFEANLYLKIKDDNFIGDVAPLLSIHTTQFSARIAEEQVSSTFLALLAGDPWKGPGDKISRN